jgi:hypothetical protein
MSMNYGRSTASKASLTWRMRWHIQAREATSND